MTNVQDQAAQSVTAAHVKLYRATGGLLGSFVAGMPVLLLMTTGRRTRERRTSPLTYFRVDDRIFVIASYGGARHHPAWYLNLEADPNVEVQRWRSTIPMKARTISGADRDRVWSRVTLLAPIYRWYQQRTDREINVVELVAIDEDGHSIASGTRCTPPGHTETSIPRPPAGRFSMHCTHPSRAIASPRIGLIQLRGHRTCSAPADHAAAGGKTRRRP